MEARDIRLSWSWSYRSHQHGYWELSTGPLEKKEVKHGAIPSAAGSSHLDPQTGSRWHTEYILKPQSLAPGTHLHQQVTSQNSSADGNQALKPMSLWGSFAFSYLNEQQFLQRYEVPTLSLHVEPYLKVGSLWMPSCKNEVRKMGS